MQFDFLQEILDVTTVMSFVCHLSHFRFWPGAIDFLPLLV
jgi:hypothetical protein